MENLKDAYKLSARFGFSFDSKCCRNFLLRKIHLWLISKGFQQFSNKIFKTFLEIKNMIFLWSSSGYCVFLATD
ncbi:MAG: hypothetical protein ACOYOK_06900 [Pseudobdellovibrionaceae bacterium]